MRFRIEFRIEGFGSMPEVGSYLDVRAGNAVVGKARCFAVIDDYADHWWASYEMIEGTYFHVPKEES